MWSDLTHVTFFIIVGFFHFYSLPKTVLVNYSNYFDFGLLLYGIIWPIYGYYMVYFIFRYLLYNNHFSIFEIYLFLKIYFNQVHYFHELSLSVAVKQNKKSSSF